MANLSYDIVLIMRYLANSVTGFEFSVDSSILKVHLKKKKSTLKQELNKYEVFIK